MKVKDIKEFQDTKKPLLAFDKDTPVLDAVRKMGAKNYGAVAVLDNGKYAGIFTERILLKNIIGHEKDIQSLSLADVMLDSVPVARLEEDAQDVMNRLDSDPYRHMPIVDDDQNFVGMLSDRDFAVYTWPEAISRAAESTQIGVMSAYQPFFIIGAGILYTFFIIYLTATMAHTGGWWF